jgi:Family of unknown function (DUF6267)
MKPFSFYLQESVFDNLGGYRGHYRHPEELFLDHGKEGAVAAHKLLHDTANNRHPLQKKGDGSLAFHIVTNVEGKKGIATKSIDNKDPKINYTHDDIEKNHGHSPGLSDKLHQLLDQAHKISGNNRHVSGEFLFTPKEVSYKGGKASFKPNTIKNDVSDEGEVQRIKNAKVGVAMHSAFNEKGERKPLEHGDIKDHPDVYNMDLSAPKINKTEETKNHLSHLSNIIRKTPQKSFDFISEPTTKEHFKAYINKTVRDGSSPNVKDFIQHVHDQHQKAIDKVKTDKSKKEKTEAQRSSVVHLLKNKEHIQNAINLHAATESTKNHLVDLINKADSNSKVTHHLENADGSFRQTGAEGWTYDSPEHHNINTLKLVNRGEFSKNNFNMNARFRKPVTENIFLENLNLYKPQSNHAVITFGRFSPPHKEHSHLVDAVTEHAKDIGGDPHVFVSHSHDKDKNPLTGNEKVAVLRQAHPEHKNIFHTSSKTSPSIFHALADLHAKGYKHATVVLGDDRIEEMKNSLHSYNGKFDKHGRGYKFNSIHVMTRHDQNNMRDESGRDGVHASDVRKAAREGDVEAVKGMLHPNLSHGMVQSIVKRIQQRTKK